jgi:hypothetical protein
MARAQSEVGNRGTIVADEEPKSNLFVVDRRRTERRILVNVPVEVTQLDDAGHPVKEKTFIEDVSDFGCRFSTRRTIRQGATVGMKILGSHGDILPEEEPRYYEIMWVAPKEHGFTAGARVLQGEKLANVKFPLENSRPKQAPK